MRNAFGSWLGLLAAAKVSTADDERLAASPSAVALLAEIERTNMSGPHKMILLGAMASVARSVVTVEQGAALFWDHLDAQHPAARPFIANARDCPRKYPMEILAKKAAHFELRGDAFAVKMPDDVPSSLVFEAIAERAEARLFEFLRTRTR